MASVDDELTGYPAMTLHGLFDTGLASGSFRRRLGQGKVAGALKADSTWWIPVDAVSAVPGYDPAVELPQPQRIPLIGRDLPYRDDLLDTVTAQRDDLADQRDDLTRRLGEAQSNADTADMLRQMASAELSDAERRAHRAELAAAQLNVDVAEAKATRAEERLAAVEAENTRLRHMLEIAIGTRPITDR